MSRLNELLGNKDSYLLDKEMIIYISNGEMIARNNNGNELIEITGEVDENLVKFINDAFEQNECPYCRCSHDLDGEPNCSCDRVFDIYEDE